MILRLVEDVKAKFRHLQMKRLKYVWGSHSAKMKRPYNLNKILALLFTIINWFSYGILCLSYRVSESEVQTNNICFDVNKK